MDRNPFRRLATLALLLIVAGLSACASSGRYAGAGSASRHPGLTCAPFARELSGIALYGDADSWWEGAAGRYRRSATPAIGSVLVFSTSDRLPSGHLSVVSDILSRRQIQVIQANWVPNELDIDQLVVDVSEANDWTAVRVWYPPVNQLGAHTYEAYGFILPPGPATHDELARASRNAAVIAVGAAVGRPPPRARGYGS